MVIWLVDGSRLNFQFCHDVDKLLKDSPFTWYVTSAYRPLDEQAKLYAKYLKGGPRAAPPGKSAHNYGLAVDVVPDGDVKKPGLQMLWDISKKVIGLDVSDKPWLWLRENIKKHPRLHSGWSFGDWPHIERYQWQKHK